MQKITFGLALVFSIHVYANGGSDVDNATNPNRIVCKIETDKVLTLELVKEEKDPFSSAPTVYRHSVVEGDSKGSKHFTLSLGLDIDHYKTVVRLVDPAKKQMYRLEIFIRQGFVDNNFLLNTTLYLIKNYTVKRGGEQVIIENQLAPQAIVESISKVPKKAFAISGIQSQMRLHLKEDGRTSDLFETVMKDITLETNCSN